MSTYSGAFYFSKKYVISFHRITKCITNGTRVYISCQLWGSHPSFCQIVFRSVADLVGCDPRASTKDLANCLRKVQSLFYVFTWAHTYTTQGEPLWLSGKSIEKINEKLKDPKLVLHPWLPFSVADKFPTDWGKGHFDTLKVKCLMSWKNVLQV
jgi:hypothetical protein